MNLSKKDLAKLQEKGFYEIIGEEFHILIFKDVNNWTVQHEVVNDETYETFPTWKNMTFNDLMNFDFQNLIDNNGF